MGPLQGTAPSSGGGLVSATNAIADTISPVALTLSAPGATIGGKSMSVDEIFLPTNQGNSKENVLWKWKGSATAAVRADAHSSGLALSNGSEVRITGGDYAGLRVTVDGGTVGTDNMTWTPVNIPVLLKTITLTTNTVEEYNSIPQSYFRHLRIECDEVKTSRTDYEVEIIYMFVNVGAGFDETLTNYTHKEGFGDATLLIARTDHSNAPEGGSGVCTLLNYNDANSSSKANHWMHHEDPTYSRGGAVYQYELVGAIEGLRFKSSLVNQLNGGTIKIYGVP